MRSEDPAPSGPADPAVPLEDQEIVFGNFGAYTPEGFFEDFTAQTGVEVTLSEFVNNEDMLGKVQAAGGAVSFTTILIAVRLNGQAARRALERAAS